MEEASETPRPDLRRRLLPAALGLALLLLLAQVPYVVDATEYVVRTRFGRPVAVVTEPGLHARVPLVDAVTRLLASFVPGSAPEKKGADTLNDREMQVYSMIGSGMATQKIATQLNLSPKTVQTYREWVNSFHSALAAYTSNQSYQNFIDDQQTDFLRAYYGSAQ